jgi:hypothetical protein
MEYDRDLNARIKIARRVMSSAGWGSCEPPEPADEAGGAKSQLNAGSLALKGEVAHTLMGELREVAYGNRERAQGG